MSAPDSRVPTRGPMGTGLAPGDLCVIVDNGGWMPHELPWKPKIVGLTVVLTELDPDQRGLYPPYWNCSGLPKAVRSVAQNSLRKIFPPPDFEAKSELGELLDTFPTVKETENV